MIAANFGQNEKKIAKHAANLTTNGSKTFDKFNNKIWTGFNYDISAINVLLVDNLRTS